MPTLVHLIYIHGFQGNDTTFQSFPKHLQERLESIIPANLDIKIQSSLYPTYKSVKPISHATKNFLEWLSTQPPGPVILMGHSMGGLLAADAATDPSNNPGGRPKRIVGVVAFDTPFLGMHPHVVVSGIASLLPKESEKEKKGKSEGSMNQHPGVNVVDQEVTDDWEAFKKQTNIHARNSPYSSETSNLGVVPQIRSRPPSPSFMDRALSYIPADDPVVKWLRKHADDPFSAGKRWITERFQFGSCMFDPGDLKRRYSLLVNWGIGGGLWVNYWTTTVPTIEQRILAGSSDHIAVGPSSAEDLGTMDASPKTPNRKEEKIPAVEVVADEKSQKQDEKRIKKEEEKARKQEEKQAKLEDKRIRKEEALKEKKRSVHHFVILPDGMAQYLGGMEQWENVPIAGVADEVGAHTGLFIPEQNLQYQALLERVATKVIGWCAT